MDVLRDLSVCLQFLSRLPVPTARDPHRADLPARSFAAAAAMAPLAGGIIGLVPAALLLALTHFGLPALPAAIAALASLVAISGALHEDGLADCADGFGGGSTRERKLAIMRDSRIGTFGACALVLGLSFRVACLAAVAAFPWRAATELVAAAAISRFACLVPLVLLAPARTDGLGARAGRPGHTAFLAAFAGAALFALLPVAAGLDLGRAASALVLAAIAALALSGLAARQIGGQTGDVAGAAQQLAEAAALLVYATVAPAYG